jgi:hypothetical protein
LSADVYVNATPERVSVPLEHGGGWIDLYPNERMRVERRAVGGSFMSDRTFTFRADPPETNPMRQYVALRYMPGDRVKVANSHGISRQYVGATGVVVSRMREMSGVSYYRLDVDGGEFAWYDDELEDAPKAEPALAPEPTAVKPFWLVWRMPSLGNPAGGGFAPTRCHGSELEARVEAGRLAYKHPGATFVVVRSVCAHEVETKHTETQTEYARGSVTA